MDTDSLGQQKLRGFSSTVQQAAEVNDNGVFGFSCKNFTQYIKDLKIHWGPDATRTERSVNR